MTVVEIAFDPRKDAGNIDKHGISLARAAEMTFAAIVEDDRFAERRFRVYGELDGKPCCLACTLTDDSVRAISLRRAHLKEYRRYVP